jgi:carboxypeptidase C (cathepsin A)
VTVDGKALNYTATVAQMPLKDPAGETEAHIFYMAYTLDGVTDPARRPLTFCFNGGPGSASMWVHMGGMGPRSPKLLPNGGMPPPPYELKDNPDTWLDLTDLVFIDPVGTGYSRAKNVDVARRMNGVQGDIQSVGEFMRMYLVRNLTAVHRRRKLWHVPRGGPGRLPDRPWDRFQRTGADRDHSQPGDHLEPQ